MRTMRGFKETQTEEGKEQVVEIEKEGVKERERERGTALAGSEQLLGVSQ